MANTRARTIKWHRSCASSTRAFYTNEKLSALKALERAESGLREVEFYEHQIRCAAASNKPGFDSETYRKADRVLFFPRPPARVRVRSKKVT